MHIYTYIRIPNNRKLFIISGVPSIKLFLHGWFRIPSVMHGSILSTDKY